MVIKTNVFFSFFSLALLGMEESRVVDYDGSLDAKHTPGIYVDELSSAQRRVREVGDILAHSAKKFFGQDEEVDTWVKSLGGMRKLDELLVGKDRLREYIRDLREIKAVHGFTPSVLGARHLVEGVETATEYDSYAVLAHRETLDKEAYGEVEEDKYSDPSWEGHESDLSSKPFWWNKIYMGKSSFQLANNPKFMAKGAFSFKQLEVSSPWNSKRVDFRIGGLATTGMSEHSFFPRFCTMRKDKGRNNRFKSLVRDYDNWYLNEDHKTIKDLTDRFYNDPKSLMWFMDPFSYGDMARLCCGTRTSTGDIIWVPLSHDAQKSFDWWLENEGKEATRFYCRALYLGEWIIAYRKAKTGTTYYEVTYKGTRPVTSVFGFDDDTQDATMEQYTFTSTIRDLKQIEGDPSVVSVKKLTTVSGEQINVRKFKACSQTGWLAKWKDVDMHFSEWGSLKKKLLKLGAKDAYFGKPGKVAEYKKAAKPSATL